MKDRKTFWSEEGMKWGPTNIDSLNKHGEKKEVLLFLKNGTDIDEVMNYIQSTGLTAEKKIELGHYANELLDFLRDNNKPPQTRQPREDGTNPKDIGAPTARRGGAQVRRSRMLYRRLRSESHVS